MNTLIELSVEGTARTVLVKELQRDPVRGRPLHTDFYLVDLDKKVEVADYVIDNGGSLPELEARTREVHRLLLERFALT